MSQNNGGDARLSIRVEVVRFCVFVVFDEVYGLEFFETSANLLLAN